MSSTSLSPTLPPTGAVPAQNCEARYRAQDLCALAAAEFETIARLLAQARETCAELRTLLDASAPARIAGAMPRRPAAQAHDAAGFAEADLIELADDLIGAYRSADAADDVERRATIGRALRAIGQRLAAGLGPAAAGAVLH